MTGKGREGTSEKLMMFYFLSGCWLWEFVHGAACIGFVHISYTPIKSLLKSYSHQITET